MLKKIFGWIWQKIWKNKFFLFSVLFFYLSVCYCGKYHGQKKDAEAYRAKYEAVSALFKPTAAACPAKLNERSGACPKPVKCPQVQSVQPPAPQTAPAARRESAPMPDYRDALSEAAEAAEKAKREALREYPPVVEANRPTPQTAPRANPAINRRDERGRLKPLPSGRAVIREPDWAR